MDRAKEAGDQKDLNNAAENSVKGAIKRGRTRRAGRPSVQNGDVFLENPATAGGSKRVAPMDQNQFVPYLKRRKTSLIPTDVQGEDDDSNDEWEAKIEVDPKVMEAAVVSLKNSVRPDTSKENDITKKDTPPEEETRENGSPELEQPSEEDAKARQRLQAAATRKRFLLRHSVHIVLSIANCIRLDTAANDEEVRGFALSVTPTDTLLSSVEFSEHLSRFALWLRAFFQTSVIVGEITPKGDATDLSRPCSVSERAIEAIQRKGGDILDVLVVVAAAVRAQGFRCRIISPLQLVSHKAPNSVRKENNVTGRKQVVEVQPDAQTDFVFFGWIEIWASPQKKWIPVDVFGGQVCNFCPADAIKDSIERIPALDVKEIATSDTNSAPDTPGDSKKGAVKKRKSKRINKRQRSSMSPSRPLRSVNENIFFHVVAVENGRVTDVTRRYASSWKEIEKARAKGRLFEKAIENLSTGSCDLAADEALSLEQEEFDKIAAEEAIPTSISAIQRHPRYVLERHLRKYEIIFPREPVVGFIKDEPIFLRANVQLLHTKDRWIRKMREVIEGVDPLKSVRSMSGTDATVDLFGSWQTNPLVIPPCTNGKVPRGPHGNVDLWTSAHLPDGAEHVNMPHAKVAARKLEVDFAPAMTGFDIRGGRSIPRIEGIVVAQENADLVRDAAKATAQAAARKKEERAREEALGRWLKLLRAVKARQKVKRLYGNSFRDAGTYEAAQKLEGLRKVQEEKRGDQKGSNASQEPLNASNVQTPKYTGSNSHSHEFEEPKHLHGDTMESRVSRETSWSKFVHETALKRDPEVYHPGNGVRNTAKSGTHVIRYELGSEAFLEEDRL